MFVILISDKSFHTILEAGRRMAERLMRDPLRRVISGYLPWRTQCAPVPYLRVLLSTEVRKSVWCGTCVGDRSHSAIPDSGKLENCIPPSFFISVDSKSS